MRMTAQPRTDTVRGTIRKRTAKAAEERVRLSHQNATGTVLFRARSLAIHCVRNRNANGAWPANPMTSQARPRETRSCQRASGVAARGRSRVPPDDGPDDR